MPGSFPRILLSIAAALSGVELGCGSGDPPESAGGPVAMRRLTASQYRQAIVDAFGSEIDIAGRFEPENRREGLIAIGSAWATMTPSGFERYEAMSNHIAKQVVSDLHRDRLVPCLPRSRSEPDAECTEAFLRQIGPGLLRRPLTEREVQSRVSAAAAATELMNDFHAGLELIVTSLLVAPDFLFRMEVAEPDPESADRLRLTDHTLASRLSYLLWNAAPDHILREAAARGSLSGPESLGREIDRMLASPRLEDGVRAFFDDVFRFDEFEDISKDPIRYPAYNSQVAKDAREQTLRVVVDHLVARDADYRDLFTTTRSFMTRALGPIYVVPVRTESGWEALDFDADDPRAGLLSHASFNLLHAHPGRSSPTLRGVFLRESLLCQNVPPAPADVDFGLFNEDDNPKYKTARDRLAVHSSNATCRNCHRLTDPIGLGLEVFHGIGRHRSAENGALIDTSGEFDGRRFEDSVGLGRAFRDSPLTTACLVRNVYRYAVGRDPVNSERRLLQHLERRFSRSGYRLRPLLREIAMSDGFRTATPPRQEPSPADPAPRIAARTANEEPT